MVRRWRSFWLVTVLLPAPWMTACHADPSTTFTVPPAWPAQSQIVAWPAQHRAELEAHIATSYAAWMTCTTRLKLVPSSAGRRFTFERKLPEDGYADVVGTRIRLPLSGWLRSPERRQPITAHEMGHGWGILDVDTGADPALMSKTTPSNVITARDCMEMCKIWWCGR